MTEADRRFLDMAERQGDARPQVPEDWPGSPFDTVTVYVLCGHKRYKMPNGRRVWMHYTGATTNLNGRVRSHRNGTSGAKLPKAMVSQGIRLRLAYTRVFDVANEGWRFEKELKRQKNAAQYCPYCRDRHNKKRRKNQRKRRQQGQKVANN